MSFERHAEANRLYALESAHPGSQAGKSRSRRLTCIGVLLTVVGAYGQPASDLRTQTQPRQFGTTLPPTCGVGQLFFKTNAAPGANLHGCTAASQWTPQGIGSAGATVTAGANSIPLSDTSGHLSIDWLPDLSILYQPALEFLPLDPSNNLSELANTAAARTSLELGPAAIKGFSGLGLNLTSESGPFLTNSVLSRDTTGTLVDSGCTASNGTLTCGGGAASRLGVRQGSAPADTLTNGTSNDAVFFLDSADGYWKMRKLDGTVLTLSGAPTVSSFVNAQHRHNSAAAGGTLDETSFGFTDVTAGNASGAAHGLLPKLPNNNSLCFRGDGTFGACGGSGGAPGGTSGQIQINQSGVFGGLSTSGNGANVATSTGMLTSGNCVKIDANGNFVNNGSACAGLPANMVKTDTANTYTSTAVNDARNASHTLPVKTGATANLPASCTTGEVFFASDATAGRNLYYCTAANAWTQESGESGGGASTTTMTTDPSGTSCAMAGALVLYTTPTPKQLWFCDGTAYRFLLSTDPSTGAGALALTEGTAPAGADLPPVGAQAFWLSSADHFPYLINSSGVSKALDTPRAPGCTFDGGGSTILTNSICYARVRTACTLSTSYSIVAVGSSPTATVDVFKGATGTALPTSTIISSATPALATGNAVVGTTAWISAAVADDDIIAFKVTAVANATWLSINLRCQ